MEIACSTLIFVTFNLADEEDEVSRPSFFYVTSKLTSGWRGLSEFSTAPFPAFPLLFSKIVDLGVCPFWWVIAYQARRMSLIWSCLSLVWFTFSSPLPKAQRYFWWIYREGSGEVSHDLRSYSQAEKGLRHSIRSRRMRIETPVGYSSLHYLFEIHSSVEIIDQDVLLLLEDPRFMHLKDKLFWILNKGLWSRII